MTRKVGERVVIGGPVVIEVPEVQAGRARLAVRVPQGATARRQEAQPGPGEAAPNPEKRRAPALVP